MPHTSRTFPELALFNCTSCHDTSMHRLEWRTRQLTEGIDPGSVLLNDANLRMAWVIARTLSARTLSAREGANIKGLIQALQKDTVEEWPHIGVSAAQLRAALAGVLTRMETERSEPSARSLLDNVLQAGIDGEYRDYLGAEQAVMAIDLLMMDANLSREYRAQRDELFRLVHSDETFRSTEFIASLKSLGEALK